MYTSHIELTGTSSKAWKMLSKTPWHAAETVRYLRWFEVIGTRGYIDNGAVKQWQVSLKIGFSLEEAG
ncbi:MAG: dodecin family protein [Candidatus Competibacteraceae bacterium]